MNHDLIIKFHNTVLLEQKLNNRKPNGRHRRLHLLTVQYWGNKTSKGSISPLHDRCAPKPSLRDIRISNESLHPFKQNILISELGNGNWLLATPPEVTDKQFLGTMQNNNQIRMEVITTNQPKWIVVEQLLAHIQRLWIMIQRPPGRLGIAGLQGHNKSNR